MNLLEGINSKLDETENQISELEDKGTVSTQRGNKKEKRLKRNEESLRDLWDNIKHKHICIIAVPEGDEGERGIENIFGEIRTETLPAW